MWFNILKNTKPVSQTSGSFDFEEEEIPEETDDDCLDWLRGLIKLVDEFASFENYVYEDFSHSGETVDSLHEKNKRVIIVKSANASGKVWFFDLVTQSWTTNNSTGTTDWHTYDGKGSFPTLSGKRVRTNLINNLKGELLYLTDCSVDDNNGNASEDNASVSQTDTHNFVIKKWNDSSKFNKNVNFTTKEFDFGNPHTKKKIHQIYVSYKMNNHEDEVATTDVETWSAQGTAWNVWNVSWNTSQYEGHYSEGFSNIYYGVDSGDLIGDFGESGYGITPTNGFVGTNGNWSIAELIPNRPINCYTFQLQFKANPDGLGIPGTFEINDLTFVYKEKKIKSRLRRNVN